MQSSSSVWFVKVRIAGKWKVICFQDQGGNQLLDVSQEPGMRPTVQGPGKDLRRKS